MTARGKKPKSAKKSTATKVASHSRASAEHHRVLRKQHESEAAQDYCEAIAELLDAGIEARVGRLAERFGLSHVTVSRVVRRLAGEGFVDARPHAPLGLTAKGRALAAEARTRHVIVLAFLRSLGVDEATAQADAEGIEHHVSPATLRAMQRMMHAASGRSKQRAKLKRSPHEAR
ncbi:MAG: iron dependent repressor, metal binding and dimerization domain protein [Limnohabitans sp.]|nr:iron dependent repressor, metal binding and dimerization domain protein [Limnohabitans sp.]